MTKYVKILLIIVCMALIPFNVFSATNGDSLLSPQNNSSSVNITDNIVSVKVGDNDYDYINFDKSTKTIVTASDFIISANIPPKIDNIDVLYIGEMAFYCKDDLKSVVLPNSIIEIGRLSFASCPNLLEVCLSNSLEKMGAMTFYSCYKLENIMLPSNLLVIDEGIFGFCYALEQINIPKSIEKININAFMNCDNLQKINFEGSRKEWTNILINNTLLPSDFHALVYYYMPMPELLYNDLSKETYVLVNEKKISVPFYNKGDDIYLKLEDISFILKDTEKSFNIDFNEKRQVFYMHKNEGNLQENYENASSDDMQNIATKNFFKLCITDDIFYLKGYKINDFIYFNLSDLGEKLDFLIEKNENGIYNISTINE